VIPRHHVGTLRRLLRQFPAVTILGPRQCGKTTFARHALPGWHYVDLESPREATPLQADPVARLAQLGDRVVLDEAQRVPEIFPVLRGVLDAKSSRVGRYVLLGSAAPSLTRGVSESLAGRTAFLDLPPLRWDEVVHERGASLQRLWLRGGYPRAWLAPSEGAWADWMEAYVRAFVERDLPSLGVDVSSATMRRLLGMLAHCHGATWNASRLASALGVSYHTINRYLDLLEQAFLVRRLPPWLPNMGKRLVKSPKVYIRDSGLVHWLLGIANAGTLDVHPSRGLTWEGFVLDHVISACDRVMPGTRAFFWRTSTGDEVDLVLERSGRIVPIEIKTHSAPGASETGALRRFMTAAGIARGHVVHSGSEDYSLGGGVRALSAGKLLADPKRIATL
jgi:hypothetical protein